ncbi:sialoadhesin-like isoform X2 [Parambassis ranga]|uniref:Sialoadhesin-like isoform X2 n=1 Tax=Parambassis ranga TaxID=210632 RepID=A0A6P7I2D1_9TELE|nr:sialoadhesin-like isoform X2 [Parambassis ranga]
MKTMLLLLLLGSCLTSASSRASVTVSPSRTQYFEYEKFSVSCQGFSTGTWRVWRYSTRGVDMSSCGLRWGTQTSSTCDMKTIKLSDSGVYWCESTHGETSNTINITVTDAAVLLQGPGLPVAEGANVTLSCRTKEASSLLTDFYRTDTPIGAEQTGHMTIHNVSKADEDESDPVSLTVSPDSTQLFEYERLTLTCGHNSTADGWRVHRFTNNSNKDEKPDCGKHWGAPTATGCIIHTVKQPDSATYWCESPSRQRSNAVKLTVHGGAVILQSPVLPVMEGHPVTLTCTTKTNGSTLPAAFYKDGSLLITQPAGHMTILHVSSSDEGLYSCDISGHGESPPSRLLVTALPSPGVSGSSVLRVVFHLVVCCPYVISTVLMVSLLRRRPTGSGSGRQNASVASTSPPAQDQEGLDRECDDVTTEYHF